MSMCYLCRSRDTKTVLGNKSLPNSNSSNIYWLGTERELNGNFSGEMQETKHLSYGISIVIRMTILFENTC
jgi:hypothetical protein